MAAPAFPKSGDLGVLEMQGTSHLEQDDTVLARLGKKAVLKRRFGFFAILGFSCTVLITWEASLILFLVGLQNGGPAGVFYGYIVVWVGTVSTFVVLSELSSMAPTSGGQYHWVSMLAPHSLKKILSYVSGWLTLCGWQATVGSAAYLTGTLVQGLIILTHPSYAPQNWHGTLLYWAVTLFGVTINVAAGWLLPKFEGTVLVLHIIGFFAVLVPLLKLGPEGNAHDVFTTFMNAGEWKSQGLSFCIGIMGSVFAFVGGDGPIHMCEEIRNAAVVVPRAIMAGVSLNGSLGLAMILAILFRSGDLDQALEENPAYPFMAIFRHAMDSTAGAAVLSSLVFVLAISATTGLLASSSRMFWAFSRDKGIPGWQVFSKVSKRTSIPVYSVAATGVIACILSLVNIGSATAFNGVISVSIAGLFSSYLLVSSLLLYRRCSGAILLRHEQGADISTTGSENEHHLQVLAWGPWRIPGIFGIVNNAFACVYLTFVFFFSFWPSYSNITAETMNWSILVTGFITLFSTVYYLAWAKHTYKGPVVEIDVDERG